MEKMLALVPICVLVLATYFGQAVEGGYVITSPKRWVKNSNSQVCFLMMKPAGPDDQVTVTISANDGGQDKSVATEVVESSRLTGPGLSCVEVFLENSEAYNGDLQVEGSLSGTKFNETRRIAFSNEIKRTFIQTDKYMYKPGQQVKFRVLTTEGAFFKVSTEPYSEIFVETPSSSRIAQWLNVTNTRGLIHEELQLIEEPEKGTYRISVRIAPGAPAIVKEFVVDDYVLPRFEVKTTAPTYVLATEPELKAKVCATYTFGQPVRGKLEGTVSNGGWGKYAKTVNVSEDIFGCTDIVVKLVEQLQINHKDHKPHAIDLRFKVTEEGTDNTEDDSAKTRIERTALRIMTEKIDFLKPQLPLLAVLKASFPDDRGAPLEPFEVCVKDTCENTTTDSAGYLRFAIPPHLLNDTVRSVEVKSINYKDLDATTPESPEPFFNYDEGPASFGYRRNLYMYSSDTSFRFEKFFSPSNSSLLILPPTEEKIQCDAGGPVTLELPVIYSANRTTEATLTIQIISRGQIQHSEQVPVTFSGSKFPESMNLLMPMKPVDKEEIVTGATTIKVSLPAVMSPSLQVMIWYTRSDGEVVPDNRKFEMTKCLSHQVSMSWPSSKVEQGTTQPLQLKAEPDSLCSLGIVDKSVELLAEAEDSLTISKLFDLLVSADPQPYDSNQIKEYEYCEKQVGKEPPPPPRSEDPIEIPGPPGPPGVLSRKKRRSVPFLIPRRLRSTYSDAISVFDNAGLLIFSDQIYETRPCDEEADQRVYASSLPAPASPAQAHFFEYEDSDPSVTASGQQTRSYFPETWLWQFAQISPQGEFSEEFKLPDTITEWVGKAVCVHPTKGVGLSARTSITTFTPFFVDLTLLPTIRQGEIMPVVISVFNYLKTSLPVRVTLEASDKYEIVEDGSPAAEADQVAAATKILCIPQDDKATASVRIRPLSVEDVTLTITAIVEESATSPCSSSTELPKKSDRIVKELSVEYEGFPREKTWTKYVCSDDIRENEDHVAKWTLEAPQNIVLESERSWITVVGDLLGPTLENLGSLIRMPTGCGEQNMITFSPNIYVLQYLEGAGLLNPITEEKLLRFMNRGYQRELNYRHGDGSFSAWGPSDPSGSTWLTAFVVKSFAQSRPYITIDDGDLEISTEWLRNVQNVESGCFENRGKVLHKEMLGGIGDDPTMLSAYVLAALLEAGEDPASKVVGNGLFCLKKGGSSSDPYGMALRAYALSLAGHEETETVLQELLAMATNTTDTIHWEVKKPTGSSHGSTEEKVSPVAVETAGYIVLAMLQTNPDSYNLAARAIIKWISEQRNGQGGFISTQDTVVALQALALYESFQHSGPLNVEVSAVGTDFTTSFKVDDTNKLLNQRFDVPTVPTNLVLDMTGEGCALMQAVVRYNVPDPEPSEAFSLTVTHSEVGETCKRRNLKVCSTYLLRDGQSNMAVIEVTLLSGYIADKSHLKQVVGLGSSAIKRYEVDGNKVQLYIDEMTNEEICASFDVIREVEVEAAKPGNVRVYDYYEPELVVSENYEFPACSQTSVPEPVLGE